MNLLKDTNSIIVDGEFRVRCGFPYLRPGTATGIVFLTLEAEAGPLDVAAYSSASAPSVRQYPPF
ncbi:MAG: hypothetical protein M3461_16530 [Pseudomonadota bacterium]|nr:hypothetical protein [Pseudomonadota bacterium]